MSMMIYLFPEAMLRLFKDKQETIAIMIFEEQNHVLLITICCTTAFVVWKNNNLAANFLNHKSYLPLYHKDLLNYVLLRSSTFRTRDEGAKWL
jgi:hypothetical protein